MKPFAHSYPYDPSYGYSFDQLLAVPVPARPSDFQVYWQNRYQQAITHQAQYKLSLSGNSADFVIFDISYQSTNGFIINGWLLVPRFNKPKQAIIVGHGYGGRTEPDSHLTIPETLFFFPCFRGLGISRCPSLPEAANSHVLYGIENRDSYVLGGCIEDLWVAVSVLLKLYPQFAGAIGYMGISFGGGIGALAIPWDHRIKRAHFNVPTFGNQPLRLSLPTTGSAAAVKSYVETHSHLYAILSYYDAAIAATYAQQTAHFALALFDPVVAPPGQFAIYNAWAAEKQVLFLEAGHFEYPNQVEQNEVLLQQLWQFFGNLRS